MSTATLSSKGQLVIPNSIRKALHLKAGDRISLVLEGERVVLTRDSRPGAKLVVKNGRKVLVAPKGAPPMTSEVIKSILSDFP